jgi:hypothetical protein
MYSSEKEKISSHSRASRGSSTQADQPPGVVEEVQPEVHEGSCQGLAIDQQVLLRHVQATGAHHDGGQIRQGGGVELVFLALVRGEVDAAGEHIHQVQLPVDDVGPGRRVCVLHVGQPDLGSGVQGVDGHLLLHRTGDLHAAVLEARSGRCHLPGSVVADVLGLRQERGVLAVGDLGASTVPAGHELTTAGFEVLVQRAQEIQGLRGEHLLLPADARRGDGDAVQGDR